ncbi:DMT family transporter [Mesobacterium pallidum]|uniref:DMT family transporter n=1 Tax=Mesobacterium pallidum TaxID=2872037 RepID=UPI001EE2314C|nr:DMT family transporter [Mesobacterium pallidum]
MNVIRAILMMILAMALLALSDMCIKLAAGLMPMGQVMSMLGVLGTGAFSILAIKRGEKLFSRDFLHPMALTRNVMEIFGAFGMIIGIALNPLTTVATILQSAPLLVTLGAAVFLREAVGPRRWAAVIIGFLGILLVLRPGTDAFSPAALFCVVGAAALAMRDLVTRLAPARVSALVLSTWGFACTTPPALVYWAIQGQPPVLTGPAWAAILGAVLTTTSGYYALTTAMRMAPVSIVAPFRYTRLIFVLAIGVTIFGERPDGLTLLGAAIIIASGLYAFLRERQLARAETTTESLA